MPELRYVLSSSELTATAIVPFQITHDFKHVGLTNDYLIATAHQLAIRCVPQVAQATWPSDKLVSVRPGTCQVIQCTALFYNANGVIYGHIRDSATS